MTIKPMLATNWNPSKLHFPLIAQPKIDGVRGITFNGQLTGRSLKRIRNIYTHTFFSQPEYLHLDGELVVNSPIDAEDGLCRKTTSAVNSKDGRPDVYLWAFDFVADYTLEMPYRERYKILHGYQSKHRLPQLKVVPFEVVSTLGELEEIDNHYTGLGYEGTIIRNPDAPYKQGRSTVREGGLLRIKRFIEEEAMVTRLEEGFTNQNEAQTNELGHTYRTSHKEGKVPNNQVGHLVCIDIKTGLEIVVSPGCLTKTQRLHYWLHQKELVGKTIKYKHFPKGGKDKPRFPTLQMIVD